MKSRELFYWGEAPAEEKIWKFDEVGEKADEPAEPGQPREGLVVLEEEKDEEDGGGKIGQEFLEKSVFVAFDFFA